ncbi:GGDEF domain-containing protein [Marichromatium gracile]|uniref:diguanylate cyclase n=1 Tax=Marichromatium gracile TaxID=1048 RepID=A0ABR5VKX2_MARGR|nr:GGDEF domain-containing protein [Marichromatium gracile]KXX66366.1 diguanylate cyclase [Marichromatium gracile]
MASQDTNHWKEKYYGTLDTLEAKEKAWAQIEKTLRYAVSRLSLAVETPDKTFEGQLESLRQAIRKNATAKQIGLLMEDISESMLRLDEQRAQPDDLDRAIARLDDLLEQQRLPGALKKETKTLRKRLRDARREPGLGAALAAYSDYARTLTDWLASSEQGSEGLFGRLFGGSRESGAEEIQTEPTDLDAQPAEIEAPLPPSDDLATTLDPSLPAFNLVLLDLIHRLDLPETFAKQFSAITTLLRDEPSAETAERAVTEIADLLARARHHLEQEKKDIEHFLSQLTGRLEALDRYLEASFGQREENARQGASIDADMSAEVARIRRSVDAAQDVDQLKLSIQGHLSNIQQHMDARRSLEQEQLNQARAEIDHLKQELGKVQEESGELRQLLHEARQRALFDSLTGLSNRLAYDERIAQECERWARYGHPAVLSIWDVDFFKRINDRFGHTAGDNVLKILGKLLRTSIRKSDFVARFGGEEFMMLLPETSIETALEVAEKLREQVAASRFQYRGQPVPVTMSCGLAAFVEGDTPEDVYRRADAALYEAKRSGRNCCRTHGG